MDLKKIKALIDLVKESGIHELEIVEGEDKLKISSYAVSNSIQSIAPQNAHIQSSPAPIKIHTESISNEVAIDNKHYINSPMVGTFYRASSPNANPFVELNQEVKKGQVLCIIEAMKLMNQIEAEFDCIIKEILVKDGAPVEFGQHLFIIEPK